MIPLQTHLFLHTTPIPLKRTWINYSFKWYQMHIVGPWLSSYPGVTTHPPPIPQALLTLLQVAVWSDQHCHSEPALAASWRKDKRPTPSARDRDKVPSTPKKHDPIHIRVHVDIYIYTSRYGLWMIIIDNYGISWSSMVIPLLYIIVIGIPYLGQSVIPFWWWYDHQLLEHWIQGACVHVSLDLLHYCGDPTAWASAVYCRILQANRSFESIKRAAVATFDLL